MATNPFVRIDNQIVERLPTGGIAIGSIRLYERQHKVKLDLSIVPYVSTGNRRSDSLFIQRLLDSNNPNRFTDLPVVYPATTHLFK